VVADSRIINVADHLPAMAEQQPYRQAVIFPQGRDAQGRVRYAHLTFRQLNEECDRLAHGLEAIGIHRGLRTVLMVRPSLEFFALTFALFKVGAVPVLVDPGMGIKALGKCLAEAEPGAFIGIPRAHVARLLFGWARKTIHINITVGCRYFWGGPQLGHLRRLGSDKGAYRNTTPYDRDEIAAILFTSGSTGVPKGAVYTHGIFNSQVEMLRHTYSIEPGEIDLCTFPLFALFAPALGMTAVIPEMDFTRPAWVEPRRIIKTIDDFGATNLFGSPALLKRVGTYGAKKGVKLPSLRRVVSAGAPVSAAVIECFSKMIEPQVQIYTPYGATESLPVCSIGSHEILNETRAKTAEGGGVCVGRPVDGMKVRVIPIRDEPITEWSEDLILLSGEIGEIVVQGPVVTREYYGRPELAFLAKIQDSAHGSFYHRMGDVGYFDDQGRLWFCGRKSHRVVTPTATLFTIPCEAVFNNAHQLVERTALVGVGPLGSMKPVLCVESGLIPIDTANRVRNELQAVATRHAHTQEIRTFLFYPRHFPVDIRHNVKIFREKLAAWAAKELR
jgi:acyl-CoA synthetase (AMP-forming)/AMP-acid ligase II